MGTYAVILFLAAFGTTHVFGAKRDVASDITLIKANLSSIWTKLREQEAQQNGNKNSGPSTCMEVKRCNPEATDGEYWLYPIMYGGEKKVKIYCHNMTSSDLATEYLTLPTTETNYIIRHDLANTVNKRECTRNNKPLIKVNYSKVRLLINAMVVQGYDYRFTETEEGIYASQANLGYGQSADCSGHRWTRYCKRYGAFSIDLRNTGVAVDPSTRWMADGYEAALFNYTRSADLTQIYCLAGGWCGKCVPEDVVRLRISDEELDDSKATSVVCN